MVSAGSFWSCAVTGVLIYFFICRLLSKTLLLLILVWVVKTREMVLVQAWESVHTRIMGRDLKHVWKQSLWRRKVTYSFVILVFYDNAHSITPSCPKRYKREQNFQLSLFICVFGQFITAFHILNFCFITFAFKMCIK